MDQPQNRRATDLRLDAIEINQAELKASHDKMRLQISENTEMTKKIEENTSEIIEFFKTAKGGIRFATVLGNTLKWVAGIATVIITLYVAVRSALGGGGH
jgi:hypothetical protein